MSKFDITIDNNSTFEEILARSDKEQLQLFNRLWQAQLQHFPDSVEVHILDAMRRPYEPGLLIQGQIKAALWLASAVQFPAVVFFKLNGQMGYRYGLRPGQNVMDNSYDHTH